MRCTVASPEGKVDLGKTDGVSLPGSRGEIQILPGHAEAFFVLGKGKVVAGARGDGKSVDIEGGLCHVRDDEVVVVT